MEDALYHFHTFKDIFILRQPGEKAKAKANALRTEFMNRRQADKERNEETCILSKKWCEM